MRILQIKSPGHAALIEEADPIAGPDEVVVRIQAVASCPHWDITMMAGRDIFDRPGFPHYPALPGQPGHEMTGVVERVGAGVATFKPGDAVVAWRTMGESKPGYYAEKACVPVADLLPRPANLSAADAAGFEMAMSVAVCFLALPDLAGQRVAVGGLGPAGMIAVQMAKAAGAARVIGFDLNRERCAFARTLGADDAFDPRSDEGQRFIGRRRRTARHEVDYAIDCSGSAASVQFQLDIVTKGLALFGVPHEAYRFEPRHFGLTLYGYRGHTIEAASYAMHRVKSGALRLAPLNTVELPLSRFAEGTALLAGQKALKILYRPEDH
jgi:threonine dehydrogenase-like Zn-dependent dehydrogenase